MCKKELWFSLALTLTVVGPVRADGNAPDGNSGQTLSGGLYQVVVQIGGRFCEYHREDVEGALRRYPGVDSVEFLNDHGTVLVRYKPGGVQPARLAEAAAGAAFGPGCKAWIDRGAS